MGEKKMHYCGDEVFGMLPGWPVCGSGDFAYKVRNEGNQSYDRIDVTCKGCKKRLEKADKEKAEYEKKMGKKWSH